MLYASISSFIEGGVEKMVGTQSLRETIGEKNFKRRKVGRGIKNLYL
jgi:hypothetical protein